MRIENSRSLSNAVEELGVPSSRSSGQETSADAGFAEELASAKQTESTAGVGAPAQTKTEQLQPVLNGSSGMGLEVVDGLIALSPSGTESAGESAAAPLPVSAFNLTTRVESWPLAMECRTAVDAALSKCGLDPSQFKMSFWEESVFYPGGGYMNRQITVETPSGERMDFDAALTLKSPHVTAELIRMAHSGQISMRAAIDS